MWRVLRSPFFDPVVELLAIFDPRGQLGKSVVRQPFPMTGDLAEAYPFFLRLNGDNTPAVIAFAPVTPMRRGQRAEVSLGLRLASRDQGFQVGRSDHRSSGFGLGNVNVLSFPRAGAIVQRC